MNSQTKNCQNCKQDFTIEPEDFVFYEKMKVPLPEKCPQCRLQLRMLYRNFKTLYKRTSSMSGKSIVSMYNQEVPFPVYDISEWWGDDWDPMVYGINIDWGQSFFEQFHSLFNKVPQISILNIQSENCEYSNMVTKSKNCYLVFGCVNNENCDYGHIVWHSKDSIDNLYIFKSESCYECIDCLNCNKLLYSQECEGCVESIGLFDCRGCLNCIGSVGLVNKSYYIFNKQVTKEEYQNFLKENQLYKESIIKKIFLEREKLRKILPQRAFFGSRNNNVSGNHIYNAHNVYYSFDVKGGEKSKFCFTVRSAIDTHDANFSTDLEECYQVLTCHGNKIMSCRNVHDSHDVYYSDNCHNCDNIFGCIGLRKKSYCIFNKQYSKEKYQELLPQLIQNMKKNNEWGAFFPKEISPFGYNESIVNEYIPLNREKAITQGFKWQDNIPSTSGQETIKLEDLLKNPLEYSNELIKEILACKNCHRNFKLISREIAFYKRLNLSLPHECFNCRHKNRMELRNPRVLFDAMCAKCNLNIKTSYKTEDQKIYKIYCEKCYQQEVY
ncbi:MAG: hypothetical protein WCS86_03600 [Candidatus Paceibacterota bacterium]